MMIVQERARARPSLLPQRVRPSLLPRRVRPSLPRRRVSRVKVAPPPDWRSFELRIDWDGHGWVILDNDTEETHKKYNDDWNKIRADRNWLLKETDYTGSFDLPEEMKKEWGEYRQKLRDITDSVHTYNPAEVKFPEMPKLKTPYEYAQSEEEDGKKK